MTDFFSELKGIETRATIDDMIREKIREFLAEKVTLEQFQRWFVPTAWKVLQEWRGEPDQLVAEIEHGLAEYTSGHATDADLRWDWRALASPVAVYDCGPRRVSSGTLTSVAWGQALTPPAVRQP